jgi:tetratricopeptide (TPR) repeat protein
MFHPRRAAGALAALLVAVLAVATARADLATGREKLTTGEYKDAVAELGKVAGKDRPAARLLLVQALLATGDHPAAETAARAAASDPDPKAAADGKVALAEVLRATGRQVEARALLEPVIAAMPGHLRARRMLALVLTDTGERDAARGLWRETMKAYDAGKLDLDSVEELFALAEAGKNLGQFQLANDSYREIAGLAPRDTEIAVLWVYLFLQKYASELAEQTFGEVLKINPNHPDAHAGLAEALLESSYDLAAAEHHLDLALAVNPRHARALLTRALIAIDQNRWDAAGKAIDAVLAVDPTSTEAYALRATVSWLRDDTKAYEAARGKAFAINKQYAELYEIVARSAVREHRYAEAIELEKQAVAMRPDYFEAMSGVGLGYLRMGQETEGLDWLKRAFKGDRYNVRTKNTLDLFEDTIPKEYVFSTSKSFRFRYHKDEQKLLSRYLEPTLERAFADMSARYGFTPKTPVTIELYQDGTDYSVRTVGLPNLGALGVCFGQVITAMSPSNGNINWGMVLWHELGHVFAIQLSNSRVPRWFTEGLSEYETLRADPAWRRENDTDLAAALAEDTLPSVTTINYEFVNPDPQRVVVAYFLSSVMIEYLAATYGFDKIVDALKRFGKGQETPEVITAITGRTTAQFDADFKKFLAARLAPYRGAFRLPTLGDDDLTNLEIALSAKPDDVLTRSRLAVGYYYAGDVEKAAMAAKNTLDLAPDDPWANFVMAEVELRGQLIDLARERYERLIALGHDSFDIRIQLANIARARGQTPVMIGHLCAAKRLDPERSLPYALLAETYKDAGETDKYLRETEDYVMLEQMQVGPLKELVDEYARRKDWAKVRTYGRMALDIFPADADLLMTLGQAYLGTSEPDLALFSYDSALLVDPPMRRPALAHLGRTRALLAKGDKKAAKAALAQASKTEPAHLEVIELQKQLP